MGNSMGRPQGVGAAPIFAVGAFGRKGLPRGVRVAALVTGNLLILGLARRMALNR